MDATKRRQAIANMSEVMQWYVSEVMQWYVFLSHSEYEWGNAMVCEVMHAVERRNGMWRDLWQNMWRDIRQIAWHDIPLSEVMMQWGSAMVCVRSCSGMCQVMQWYVSEVMQWYVSCLV